MKYQYLFGPVPSRRLGMSLGVDLVPHKVCTFNCVYCECGKTTVHTIRRDEYVPVDEVIKELGHYFINHPAPDYITFSGAGEPSLNSGLGRVMRYIKDQRPDIPLAVLTNGSLLHDPSVREEMSVADLVLPSLDAATEEVFRKIDRPAPGILLKDYIQGLIEFRREFNGEIWLEVFIIPGYNDDKEHLVELGSVIEKINPDRIQLNTLDRPGTIKGIRPANLSELRNIQDLWKPMEVSIIASFPDRKEIRSYREDVEDAILGTIARRPCTLADLSHLLGLHENEINKYLSVLEKENKIRSDTQARGVFYQLTAD